MSTENYRALVLNADFTPISVAPLSTWDFGRTMRNVLKERVTVLEEYDVEFRSANLTYKPPSVVLLKRYINKPKRVVFNRMNIFLRDNFTCQYCGSKCHSSDLTFDHVIPRSKGGKTNFTNIVAACIPCNTRKGASSLKPVRAPIAPSAQSMPRIVPNVAGLQTAWIDYLYWSGVLEQDN